VSLLAAREGLTDGPGRRVHRERERRPGVIERTELPQRDAAEIAEERALVIGQEDVAILGVA